MLAGLISLTVKELVCFWHSISWFNAIRPLHKCNWVCSALLTLKPATRAAFQTCFLRFMQGQTLLVGKHSLLGKDYSVKSNCCVLKHLVNIHAVFFQNMHLLLSRHNTRCMIDFNYECSIPCKCLFWNLGKKSSENSKTVSVILCVPVSMPYNLFCTFLLGLF